MKKTLSLLVASTAMSATLGLPVLSAQAGSEPAAPSELVLAEGSVKAQPIILLNGDDDDEGGYILRRHGDDDDDDDEGCEGDDDDDGACQNGGRNPAPAGTVAPPANGLFGTGAAPQVKVN